MCLFMELTVFCNVPKSKKQNTILKIVLYLKKINMKKTILFFFIFRIFYSTTVIAQCNNVALGKPVYVSNTYLNYIPAYAVDGSCGQMWNSGGYVPQFIEIDLLSAYTINNINMKVEMTPNGNVNHQIYTSPDMVTWTLADVVTGFLLTGQLIERCYSSSPLINVRGVRINSVTSNSWIAYSELGIFTLSPSTTAVINASGPLSFCQGGSVTLASDTAFSYLWNTGATTQSITVYSAGTYSVATNLQPPCIQGSSVCTICNAGNASVTVSILPDPVVNVSPQSPSICSGGAVNLIATGADNYSWAPATGLNMSTGSTVSASPTLSTTYTIIGVNTFGCADTISKTVQVNYNPTAVFTTSDICFGDSAYFLNASSVNPIDSIISNVWVFGDGVTSGNVKNPVHEYANAGAYNVTLVTTTTAGCSDGISHNVNIYDAPVSAFTFSNSCLFDSAVFTNASANPTMGNIGSWSWDFGNGTSQNTTTWNPHYLYSSPGTYPVTLITYSSSLGCPDTLIKTITVFPMPAADFVSADACQNHEAGFSDLSGVASGTISGWSWNFGDGSPINNIQNPSHTYADYGVFPVVLISTTDSGCTAAISKNTVVHPPPYPMFSFLNVCDGTSVLFTNLSSILPTDTLQSCSWNFGDGSLPANNQNPSHLYASAGNYIIKLNAVSNFGCFDSISKTAFVNPNPVVSFSANDTVGCEPLCVTFQNSSSIAAGSIASWLWTFGDNSSTSNSQSPFHCYTNDSIFLPDYFNATLYAASDSSCITALTKNNYITVYPNPNAGFTVLPQTAAITNPVVSTANLSSGSNFWNWSFGDNDTSSALNPAPHTYADTGTYTITLITSTQFNCLDTTSQTITIEPDFVFYIPNAFTPNDDGVNDTFSGRGIFISKFEMRIFDRWGNMIFLSDDIIKSWDGKANHGAEIAPRDVYIYDVKVTDFKNRKHDYKGIVTLVR